MGTYGTVCGGRHAYAHYDGCCVPLHICDMPALLCDVFVWMDECFYFGSSLRQRLERWLYSEMKPICLYASVCVL